ncbi:MAG: hypothetical protein K1000chlam2_00898 [Chlamydiae bacterium]|nr:hypothetical protein [Chlamydiota bacterium]
MGFMLTDKDRKQILANFLETIEGISDKEYQKRVWIRGEGPEVDDFTETVCHFFDDGDPILKKYKEYNIIEKQYRLLVQFRKEFESFVDGDRPYLPEEFIDTPEWKQIMSLAKNVLKAFDYQKG